MGALSSRRLRTSALIGASRVEQVEQNVAALQKLEFAAEELSKIEGILKS